MAYPLVVMFPQLMNSIVHHLQNKKQKLRDLYFNTITTTNLENHNNNSNRTASSVQWVTIFRLIKSYENCHQEKTKAS